MEHAEQEILHVLNRLFFLLDERGYDALAELFMPNGRWHRQGRLLQGRAAILDALATRSETMQVCHVISNGFVEVTGPEVAIAHCVMTAYRHDSGATPERPAEIFGPAVLARIQAQFAHSHEGWRIHEMTMRYLFTFADLARPASRS